MLQIVKTLVLSLYSTIGSFLCTKMTSTFWISTRTVEGCTFLPQNRNRCVLKWWQEKLQSMSRVHHQSRIYLRDVFNGWNQSGSANRGPIGPSARGKSVSELLGVLMGDKWWKIRRGGLSWLLSLPKLSLLLWDLNQHPAPSVNSWCFVFCCVVEFGAFTSVIITHVSSHRPAWLSLLTEAPNVSPFSPNMSLLSSVFVGRLIAPWGIRGHSGDGALSPGTGLVGWRRCKAPSLGWPDEAGPGASDPSSAFRCGVERSDWVLPPSIQGGPGP